MPRPELRPGPRGLPSDKQAAAAAERGLAGICVGRG